MISWKLTVEKILSFSGGFYVRTAQSSWFSGDKQGTSTLFFCVIKPLYGQFFDWNCCVDIDSEGKIWKSVQPFNSLFQWKNEYKSFGDVKYTIFLANSGRFQAFSKSLERMFWLKTWYIHVFSRKSQKFVIFLGKMQEIGV